MAAASARAALPIAADVSSEDEALVDSARDAKPSGFRLNRAPGTAVSLGAYAGIALLSTREKANAHMFAGALARWRIDYVQLGGYLEVSDRVQDEWRTLGGFVGGVIPFQNWVDIELALGAGVRRYQNPSQRYGPGGYSLKTPTLGVRAGFSDRSSRSTFGIRFGAEFLLNVDLGQRSANWQYRYTDAMDAEQVVSGVTRVGGVSVGLAVNGSFEVATRRGAAR
jgi:hypothetical protein